MVLELNPSTHWHALVDNLASYFPSLLDTHSPRHLRLIRSHWGQPTDQGVDEHAFVEPTKNSIWPTICQRGIYANFRPINPLTMVETCICIKSEAVYYHQDSMASKFTINIFETD